MRSCYLAVASYLICFVVHAGPVQIPDVNLHADVVAALEIPHDSA